MVGKMKRMVRKSEVCRLSPRLGLGLAVFPRDRDVTRPLKKKSMSAGLLSSVSQEKGLYPWRFLKVNIGESMAQCCILVSRSPQFLLPPTT